MTFDIEELPQAKVKGIDVPHKIPPPQGDSYLAELSRLGIAGAPKPAAVAVDDGDFKKVHGKDGKSQVVS